MSYKTEQEDFWSQDFGDDYIGRNSIEDNFPQRLHLFSRILQRTPKIKEIFEFGANIGNNLHALHALLPSVKLKALEINPKAVEMLRQNDWLSDVHEGSLLEKSFKGEADLVFTSGVLIHINPDELPKAYKTIK